MNLGQDHRRQWHVGLYTILPSLIINGAWHNKGGSVGEAYIAQWPCSSIAIG